MGLPVINSLRIDPADTDRVLAALQNHGIYESLDGGATWTSLAGDLIVPVPGYPGEWVHSALDVVVDSVDPQILVGAFLREGLYRTTDGGAHWLPVGASLQPGNASLLARFRLVAPAADLGTIYALEDKWSILRSTDSGATWAHVDSRPIC